MGASNFSGLFSKNPDYFDGDAKETRSTRTKGSPDMYQLITELALHRAAFTKAAVDGAAATATPETPFAYFDTYVKSLRKVLYIPNAALTADSTNFATLIVRSRTAAGALVNIVAQMTTKLTGAGGSGNWTQNVPVSVPLSDGTNVLALDSAKLDVPAGGYLTFEITKGGTGVVIPVGSLQLTLL